jgi:hypothetical protein
MKLMPTVIAQARVETVRKWLCVCLVASAGSGIAIAQAPQLEKDATISQIEDYSVGPVERLLVRAADAMPEDKFSFAPTNGEFKGVRTFAQQVKHVAVTNYAMASAILQEKPPVDLGGNDANGPANIASKTDAVNFLKASFVYLHKAFSTINESNVAGQVPNPEGAGTRPRLDLANRTLWHSLDHYGQMVEYLRMNGIIPPASGR